VARQFTPVATDERDPLSDMSIHPGGHESAGSSTSFIETNESALLRHIIGVDQPTRTGLCQLDILLRLFRRLESENRALDGATLGWWSDETDVSRLWYLRVNCGGEPHPEQ
jgi:hypothetical protein